MVQDFVGAGDLSLVMCYRPLGGCRYALWVIAHNQTEKIEKFYAGGRSAGFGYALWPIVYKNDSSKGPNF
jgi:hypothetical protein